MVHLIKNQLLKCDGNGKKRGCVGYKEEEEK